MNLWKKITAAALAAATLGGCMTGCTKKKAGSEGGIVQIHWWRSNGHDKEYMQDKVKEFNETIGKERGIELIYDHKDGDMEQMIDLAYTSDQAPDMFTTWKISERAQKNQIAALDDIPGMEKMIEKFGKNALEGRAKYHGKIYDLPVSTATYGLIYNVQMFKDAGIVDENGNAKPPVTWDEVVEYAKKLTNTANQEYGFIIPAKWDGFYITDVNMTASAINGITDGYNPQLGEYDMSGPATVIKAYVHMLKDGSVVPGIEGIDNDPARARFGQGKIGMKIAGSYDVGVLRDQFPAKIEWAVAPLPVVDPEHAGMQYESADGMFSVNKASVEKIGAENVVAIYEFFTSDDIQKELYKAGIRMPIDNEIVKEVDLSGSDDMNMKNWATFASFTAFSQCPPMGRSSEITGEKGIVEMALEILNEQPSDEEIDSIFARRTELTNKGMAIYEEHNPDYDPNLYIIKDWKLLR